MKNKAVTIMAIIAVILVAAAVGARLAVDQEPTCTLSDPRVTCGVITYGPDGNLDVEFTNTGTAELTETRITLVAPNCKAEANTRFYNDPIKPGDRITPNFQCVERIAPLKGELTILYGAETREVISGKVFIPS